MPFLSWDASALAKRYVPEPGSSTVDDLFAAVPPSKYVLTFLGYAEAFAVIQRTYNRQTIKTNVFMAAKSSLRQEFIESLEATLLHISQAATLEGIPFIERHNLNASDAAILATYLRFQRTLGTSEKCVLVASDLRLIRAAQSEGLAAINPEQVTLPVSTLLARI